MTILERLNHVRQLARYFGLDWLVFRAGYAARSKTGMLRRQMPICRWDDRPLDYWLKDGVPSNPSDYVRWRNEQPTRFFFTEFPSNLPDNVVTQAEALLSGKWKFFGHTDYDLGFPPDWHFNPLTQSRVSADRHWSQISDFAGGDIKFIWELSRFGFVYRLLRAYAVTGDEHFPAAFWQLFEDWMQQNSPNTGPNWRCGQETTFRLMALCFGLYGFAKSRHSTPERVVALTAAIAVHAERIAGNTAYARSQKNNHGVSEAVGLWTAGLLFPEFKKAAQWREYGRQFIELELSRQIYCDGAYIQHSTNYHRVMLHNCLWALRLGELNNDCLPQSVYQRVGLAVEFLYQLLDIETGSTPNYGANDGALILPLNSCDYTDFRPVLQAGNYLIHKTRLFQSGPWDEDLVWLFGNEALSSDLEQRHPTSHSACQGGYYTLRGDESWAMLRCAEYRDRPSHADQLHVDLWWHGFNIACDAGTYLYNAESPWNNALSATEVHNTVSIDGLNQMTKISRFLWLDWAQGHLLTQVASDHIAYLEGQHDGYKRLSPSVIHRRAVLQLSGETWAIVDRLESTGTHAYRLHWLLPDMAYDLSDNHLTVHTEAGDYHLDIIADQGEMTAMHGAKNTSVPGWRSRFYGSKAPAISISVETSRDTIISLFSPEVWAITRTDNIILLKNQHHKAEINLNTTRTASIVNRVVIDQHILEIGR